jgi:SAM-dependent methyltransferase
MGGPAHWDRAYKERGEAAVSWFQAAPELSLSLICEHVTPKAAVIDVGAGASRLVDGLLERGFSDVAALDMSGMALSLSMARLGARAEKIDWFIADACGWTPPKRYRFWHDRAVFHFLTEAADRADYLSAMQESIAPGGYAAISSFAEDGPEICSGLRVQRYAPDDLAAELDRWAPGVFTLERAERHTHVTPQGREQRFQTSLFRRVG